MKLMIYILSIITVFSISSCIEIIDDLTLNSDGTGSFKYTINLSASKIKINSILALDSLDGKKIGNFVKKGQQIASLGLPEINGDYAPHLHFQIIIDMENKVGDYPGVCNQNRLAFYLENCPDPNLLLKIY